MDPQKFGKSLATVGGIGVAVSVAWWFLFFVSLNHQVGGAFQGPPPQCLFVSSGPCGFMSMAGSFPYNPLLLWISAAAVVVGLVVLNSSAPGTEANSAGGDTVDLDSAAESLMSELHLKNYSTRRFVFGDAYEVKRPTGQKERLPSKTAFVQWARAELQKTK